MKKATQARSRRGAAMILYTVLLPTLLLFCGLAIDLSILYVVQTRLSAAVDGAALGAGRLLGSSANTNEIANEFLNANYPAGYWGTTNLTPNISVTTNASLHTIVVTASVQAPLLFLRILRQNNCTVAATATAVRRDVRIELVLDRSYSMVNQMSTLRSVASNFVNMFIPGHDEMGLVILSGSSYTAYPNPTQTPSYNYTGGNGPDVHYADPVTGTGQNMLTTIAALQVGTDTNTSEAVWLAYKELQKAMTADSDPTKANVIVLFTDGLPNGFTAYLNDPSHNALAAGNCYYNPSTGTSNKQIGWIATAGNASDITFFSPYASSGNGFYVPLIFNTAHSNYWWASTVIGSYVPDMNQVTGTPMYGCYNIGDSNLSGLAKIPPQDFYGNSTTGTAYTQGALYKKYGIAYDQTKPNNGYHMGLASWNVADNAAQKILADTTSNIAIYTIGFTGDGGVDAALLKRMANDATASSYNSNYATGEYVEAWDAASLQNAFWQVASQILRLTH
ncbi:MAG TPA: pilus assembly protein [Bryobacteraceae bacterium]|jgi:Flp pilus assembly protein TadG